MKSLIALALLISSLPLFAQDASTNAVAAPPVSEEAHKHFVMGTALFKDAKTAEDYAQVIGEFKQVTDLAPQWPDARYNLAAVKEAAGDLSGAMADWKLYQQFKLSDAEARTAQDKIYVLEAKIQKIATAKVEEQKAAAAAAAAAAEKKRLEEKKYSWLLGSWKKQSTLYRPNGQTVDFGQDDYSFSKDGNYIADTKHTTFNAMGAIRALFGDSDKVQWEARQQHGPGEANVSWDSVSMTVEADKKQMSYRLNVDEGRNGYFLSTFTKQ